MNDKKSLKIYVADLTQDTVGLATDALLLMRQLIQNTNTLIP